MIGSRQVAYVNEDIQLSKSSFEESHEKFECLLMEQKVQTDNLISRDRE